MGVFTVESQSPDRLIENNLACLGLDISNLIEIPYSKSKFYKYPGSVSLSVLLTTLGRVVHTSMQENWKETCPNPNPTDGVHLVSTRLQTRQQYVSISNNMEDVFRAGSLCLAQEIEPASLGPN